MRTEQVAWAQEDCRGFLSDALQMVQSPDTSAESLGHLAEQWLSHGAFMRSGELLSEYRKPLCDALCKKSSAFFKKETAGSMTKAYEAFCEWVNPMADGIQLPVPAEEKLNGAITDAFYVARVHAANSVEPLPAMAMEAVLKRCMGKLVKAAPGVGALTYLGKHFVHPLARLNKGTTLFVLGKGLEFYKASGCWERDKRPFVTRVGSGFLRAPQDAWPMMEALRRDNLGEVAVAVASEIKDSLGRDALPSVDSETATWLNEAREKYPSPSWLERTKGAIRGFMAEASDAAVPSFTSGQAETPTH